MELDEDLKALLDKWCRDCPAHDLGMVEHGCACPPGDIRTAYLALLEDMQRQRDELTQARLDAQPQTKAAIDAFLKDPSTGVRRLRPLRRMAPGDAGELL